MAGWFSHLGVRTKGRPDVNIPCQIARPTVWVNGVDTGVPNRTAPNGCTINDLLDADGPWSSRAELLQHVNEVARELYARGLIDGRERGELTRAAARSDVGERR